MAGNEMLKARVGKSEIPVLYRRVAPVYDAWARLTESTARRRCLELADIQDGECVLEVAVGTGLGFAEILKDNQSGHNEGIDLTEEMLERARSKARNTGRDNFRLRVGDAYDLDYRSETFDAVVNNYMFDLLPEEDFVTVLTEFKRVLRPGGRLAMVNMTIAERWYQSLWERLYQANPAWMGGCRGVQVAPSLTSAGFVKVQRETVSQMSFPSEVILALKPIDNSEERDLGEGAW